MERYSCLFVLMLLTVSLASLSAPPNLEESGDGFRAASDSRLELTVMNNTGIPLSGAEVTIIDGWTNLIVAGPMTMSTPTELMASLPAGPMRIEARQDGYVTGSTIVNLFEGNLTFADVDLLPITDDLHITGLPSAEVTLTLDQSLDTLSTTLDSNGSGILQTPSEGSGWLQSVGGDNHSLTRWSGENSTTLSTTGAIPVFGSGAGANSTGTLRIEHHPSRYWDVLSWVGVVETTIPTTEEGEWRFYNVEDGIRIGQPLVAVNQSEVNLTSLLTDGTDWNRPEWTGHGWLNLTTEPSAGGTFSATWEADYTIPTDFGSALLPGRAAGLVDQIDEWLGDGDGSLSGAEQSIFAMLFSDFPWRESNHLMLFDERPLVGNITVSSISISQYSTIGEGSLSWSESGNLSGLAGWGSSRMFWFPVRGDPSEAIPITVNLPDDWELRYSPQMDLLTHNHSSFTVNRSLSPSSGVWTVTVGQNQPPIADAHIVERPGLSIPHTKNSTLISDCHDSSPEPAGLSTHWELRRGQYFHADHDGDFFNFTPLSVGFYAGDVLNVTMVCRDWGGASSTWWGDFYVDGEAPMGVINLSEELRDRGLILDHDIMGVSDFAVRSGAYVTGVVNATDDSGAVVQVTWSSNMTEGWTNEGSTFVAQITQGSDVNWMHMSVDERHLQRELTKYSLNMEMRDAAGNSNNSSWNVTVLDNNPPTITAEVMVDGFPIGPLNPARPNSQVSLNLTRSFDDIDAIVKTTWAIYLDGVPLLFNASWDDVRLFTLPAMQVGQHQLHIMAADSSGNLREVISNPVVEPPLPANVSGVAVAVSSPAIIGSEGTIDVTLNNSGATVASALICYHSTCEEWEVPAGDSGGPGEILVPLAVSDFESGRIVVEVEWSDAANDVEGQFSIESGIMPTSQYAESSATIMALLLFGILVYLVWKNQRGRGRHPF